LVEAEDAAMAGAWATAEGTGVAQRRAVHTRAEREWGTHIPTAGSTRGCHGGGGPWA